MNKLTAFYTIILMLVILASCEKNEDTNLLLGKWVSVSLEYITYENGITVDEGFGEPDFYMLDFKKNGTLIGYADSSDQSPTVELSWSRSGNILSIEGNPDITIETLTKQSLVFYSDVTEVDGDITYRRMEIYTCTKVE